MKATVIGRGNVGSLFAGIFNAECVDPHTLAGLPEDAELYIIAVKDSAVKEVAEKMPEVPGIVVHTTGCVPMDILSHVKCAGYGVLYPFQTISKHRMITADEIPLLIEADSAETEARIEHFAEMHGFTNIGKADSDMRKKVHLAGIFVCNFPNALISIGQKILQQCGIDGKIAAPLVAETTAKLKELPASAAQTGPAVRKDTDTIDRHLALLDELDMNEESEIYRLISSYIMRNLT